VIAHGMYTMALAGQAVADWVGDPSAVVDFGVRFVRPVPVPDDDAGAEVVISGAVRKLTAEGHAQVDLTVLCAGAKVLGQARAVVRVDRPDVDRAGGDPVGKGVA